MGIQFKTIVADPPWQYRNEKTGGSMVSGAKAKYPTMSVSDICNLDIRSICDRDACLFLWATTPLLPEAIHVLEAWGFHYKTAVYWWKTGRLGLGFWFRGVVEICLVGIKGNVGAFRCQKPNLIEARAALHSQKPAEFYDLIEPISLPPRAELFARHKRVGWYCWGNEVQSDFTIGRANQRDYI